MMHNSYGDDNPNNKWLGIAAEYVLGEIGPQVYYGENAPGFAGNVGLTFRTLIRDIGKKHGYTMSVYRTKSLLHGLPQVRERSFYFLWKGDKVPLLNYFRRPYTPIEQLIVNADGNFQQTPINAATPSHDPFYRYVLEVIEGGKSHTQFAAEFTYKDDEEQHVNVNKRNVEGYILKKGHTYEQVAEWCESKGYERQAAKAVRKAAKLAAGGGIMRRGVIVPQDHIGAFVGHYPKNLTHPVQDRFITYREALAIMDMPLDFELLDPTNSVNHICQNVPVRTAQDMAEEVLAVLNDERPWISTDYVAQYNHSMTHKEGWDNDNVRPVRSLEEMFA